MEFLAFLGVIILGAVCVGGFMLLVLRGRAAVGGKERRAKLAPIAQALAGELETAGVMGHDTITITSGGISGRIVFFQIVSQYQTRYQTHFIFETAAIPSSAELLIETSGNSPYSPFSVPSRPELDAPYDAPPGLQFRSTAPDVAREFLADTRFQEFLKRLSDMLGLAKFELLFTEKEMKFAIEGFILETEVVAEVCAVLSSYAAEH